MAVCGDKDMAAVPTIWSQTSQVYGRFIWLPILRYVLEVNM